MTDIIIISGRTDQLALPQSEEKSNHASISTTEKKANDVYDQIYFDSDEEMEDTELESKNRSISYALVFL